MNTNENAIRKFSRNHSIKGLMGMLSIVAICVASSPAQAMSEEAKCAMKADLLTLSAAMKAMKVWKRR